MKIKWKKTVGMRLATYNDMYKSNTAIMKIGFNRLCPYVTVGG